MTEPLLDVPLLDVEDLKVEFRTAEGVFKAVDGVNLRLDRGRVLGLVGESGCGKTMTALSILRLIPSPPGRITGGSIRLDGQDLLGLDERAMRAVRGRRIAMVFQEPSTALNPVLTAGEQVAEMLRVHLKMGRAAAWARAVELLQLVGIPSPDRRARDYPHQLSGGMRQRVMIAMAVACSPDLLIADEPTTALDVTIQAQILALLDDLRRRLRMAMILISHDLGVIAETADEVAIMYAGRIVESATTEALFARPLHPYTIGLMHSLPRFDSSDREGQGRLQAIPGTVPSLAALPAGCTFHPRCDRVMDLCRDRTPALLEAEPSHLVHCWLHQSRPS